MPNIRIPHPTNGTYVYGYVPEKKSKSFIIPAGPVLLKRGRDTTYGGFGARHIWGRHERELRQRGCKEAADVPLFVASIVCPGSQIHCEFEEMTRLKVTVVRDRLGSVVLQYNEDAQMPHYSVVTAFTNPRRRGSHVGQIRSALEQCA